MPNVVDRAVERPSALSAGARPPPSGSRGNCAISATPLPPRARRQHAGSARVRNSLSHRFSSVFHRFRPFSVGVEIEIRPRNQAPDGFRRPRSRQKTVKTVKTDSERFFLEGGVPESRTDDRPMPMPSALPPSTVGGRLSTPVWLQEETAATSPPRRAAASAMKLDRDSTGGDPVLAAPAESRTADRHRDGGLARLDDREADMALQTDPGNPPGAPRPS